ncbi:MAG: alpha/beta fold hydrolase, partial [Flavobacteriaceae bacterium]
EKLGLRININILKNASEAIGEGLDANAQSSVPCLFLKGGNSEYILNQDHLIIQHHFPNAEIKEIAAAGHWLHAEQPTIFFQQVNAWLNSGV